MIVMLQSLNSVGMQPQISIIGGKAIYSRFICLRLGMGTDVFTKEKRSEIMKKIPSRDTSWELEFRRKLWARGLRYRTHYGPHQIDIAFPGQRVALFLDSCFWHYCPEHRELPKSNREFWRKKLEGNHARDRRVKQDLEGEGWTVVRMWSHEYRTDPEAVIDRFAPIIRNRPPDLSSPQETGATAHSDQ